MLINTLFLSKPLTENELVKKSSDSEKLFGFLFSEIINVNDDNQKISLVPELVGGNLIDYKSVFINYNFDSNVVLTNSQTNEVNDPIVSLSKLFFNIENTDNQKLNEAEKIVYSPQQFVSSLSQLIKSLNNNENKNTPVEFKLFSNNFIFSKNVNSQQLPNIEKFLLETIENEASFSLTLQAFDKQILFEISSQVDPSLITHERKNYLEGNLNFSVYKKILNDIIASNKSDRNEFNYLSNFSEIQNDLSQHKDSISSNRTISNTLDNQHSTSNSNISDNNMISAENNIGDQKNGNLVNSNLSSANPKIKIESNAALNSIDNQTVIEKTNHNQLKITSVNNRSNYIIQTKIPEITPNEKLNQTENLIKQLDKTTAETQKLNSEIQKFNTIEKEHSNLEINNIKKENPQLKIVIKGNNQVSNASLNQDNLVELNEISDLLSSNSENKKIELIAKINSQSSDNIRNTNEYNSTSLHNDIASERQLQNLFRSINTNNNQISNKPLNTVLNTNNNDGSENLNTSLKLNENTKQLNKENVQNNEIKDRDNQVDRFQKKEILNTIKSDNKNINIPKSHIDRNINVVKEFSSELTNETKVKEQNNFNVNKENIISHQSKEINLKPEVSSSRDVKPEITEQTNNDLIKNKNAESRITSENRINSESTNNKNQELNTSRTKENFSNVSVKNENGSKVVTDEKVSHLNIREISNQKTFENNQIDSDSVIDDKNWNYEKVSDNLTKKNNSRTDEDSLTENHSQIKFYKDIQSEKKVNTNLSSLKNNHTLDSRSSLASDELQHANKKPQEFQTEQKSSDIHLNDNSKNQKDISQSNFNSLRVVSEKPIKNVVGLNTEKVFVEKNVNSENFITKSSDAKIIEADNQTDRSSHNQSIKNETKTELGNNQDKSSKDFTLENKNSNPKSPDAKIIEADNQTGRSSHNQSIKNETKTELGNNQDKSNKDFTLENKNSNPKSPDAKIIEADNQTDRSSHNQSIKNETKTELGNNQDKSNKDFTLENKNSSLNEDSKSNSESSFENDPTNVFKDQFQGVYKKAIHTNSRSNTETSISNNKFDFNKFIELKSIENFVKTFNSQTPNYRAELNTSIQNNNSVELRLYPEELGRIKIYIETLDNTLSARIEVQSEQVKNIILSNLPRLKESLNQEGMNIQYLDVQLSSEEQRRNHNANQNKKHDNKMIFDTEEQAEEVKIKNLGYNTIEYLA